MVIKRSLAEKNAQFAAAYGGDPELETLKERFLEHLDAKNINTRPLKEAIKAQQNQAQQPYKRLPFNPERPKFGVHFFGGYSPIDMQTRQVVITEREAYQHKEFLKGWKILAYDPESQAYLYQIPAAELKELVNCVAPRYPMLLGYSVTLTVLAGLLLILRLVS